MKKFLQILTKILAKEDYFYISLILISFITTLIIEDGSWQLILVSIGILFLVALISSVAQKFTEYVENVPRSAFTSTYDYEVTTQSSEMGTRQTIENFDKTDEFEEISGKEKVKEAEETPTVQSLTGNSFNEEFSGVRIIRKKKTEVNSNFEDTKPNTFKSVSVNINEEEELTLENEDFGQVGIDNLFGDSTAHSELGSNTNSILNEVQITNENQKNIEFIQTPFHTDYEKILLEVPANTFFEIHPIFGSEPKKELEYFISRVLLLIKSTVNVNTIGLFLIDQSNQNLRLYSYISENDNLINPNTSIELGNDIISLVHNSGNPEILTGINLASVVDIMPYYNTNIEIKSFAGVPIYQKKDIIGVLALDSFESNAFNSSVIGYIGNLTRLLSSLLTSLNEKFELMVSAKTLDAINMFRSMLKDEKVSFDQILSASFETIKEILGFENIGFCNYSSQANSWKIQALQGSESFVRTLNSEKIAPHKALISQTLFNNEIIFLSPIGSHTNLISEKEPFIREGYFVSVPLKSLNSSYGAFFVYGDNYQNLTHYDAKILGILCEQIASTIEKYLYINVYQNSSQIDPLTGLLNPNAFYKRLLEEIDRAKDFNTNLSFMTIQIDSYETYKNFPGIEDSIQKLVIDILKTKTRKYDLLGHIDESILGLILLNLNPNDIRVWADQIRKEIANKFITFEEQRFALTISMGIASLGEKENIDTLSSKTLEMLRNSVIKKNTISVY